MPRWGAIAVATLAVLAVGFLLGPRALQTLFGNRPCGDVQGTLLAAKSVDRGEGTDIVVVRDTSGQRYGFDVATEFESRYAAMRGQLSQAIQRGTRVRVTYACGREARYALDVALTEPTR